MPVGAVCEPPPPRWVREPAGFRRRVSRAIRTSGLSHRRKAELLRVLIDQGAAPAWKEFRLEPCATCGSREEPGYTSCIASPPRAAQ